ncbi:MAG TPA: ribosomal protein S18-alanine N-acetyltransferase [Bryobacteraceae bacterium]|nr:ribosomal protein S18-alanine N-acetyltransferase [Bryobacteraceae bacterium]
MTGIRRGEPSDLEAVAAIQDASPEAARWTVSDYPEHDFQIAVRGGHIAGFLVSRRVAQGETEILNLAVAPEWRRQGVARTLLAAFLAGVRGTVFLEVRESNQAARNIYKSMGFQEVGCRRGYYDYPPESAIVMKFHSC